MGPEDIQLLNRSHDKVFSWFNIWWVACSLYLHASLPSITACGEFPSPATASLQNRKVGTSETKTAMESLVKTPSPYRCSGSSAYWSSTVGVSAELPLHVNNCLTWHRRMDRFPFADDHISAMTLFSIIVIATERKASLAQTGVIKLLSFSCHATLTTAKLTNLWKTYASLAPREMIFLRRLSSKARHEQKTMQQG